MTPYSRFARWYETFSAESVYGVGRRRAVPALHLVEGSRVLDVGCGTGLDLALLIAAVGTTGQVVGVDRSPEMLEVARGKSAAQDAGRVVLVTADAEGLEAADVCGPRGVFEPFDAVLFTYSLSLMPQWPEAWRRASALVRPGGRAAIVDMELPHGRARLLSPLARLACLIGGADIGARPWTGLEADATQVESWSLRGGHVQVRAGTL